MNLTKLFETQRALDARIVKEKGLEGQDLVPMKILALQVELGELANEWRGFKFWSKDREPRTQILLFCSVCDGTGDLNHEKIQEDAEGSGGHEYIDCEDCSATGKGDFMNPLLEEYVDCLHFILSIGNDLGFNDAKPYLVRVMKTLGMISVVFKSTVFLEMPGGRDYKWFHYENLISNFLSLGKALGFTWEQIETAYFAKNEINHERQQNGY